MHQGITTAWKRSTVCCGFAGTAKAGGSLLKGITQPFSSSLCMPRVISNWPKQLACFYSNFPLLLTIEQAPLSHFPPIAASSVQTANSLLCLGLPLGEGLKFFPKLKSAGRKNSKAVHDGSTEPAMHFRNFLSLSSLKEQGRKRRREKRFVSSNPSAIKTRAFSGASKYFYCRKSNYLQL